MSFRVFVRWVVPGYRTHKRRLTIFDKWFDAEYPAMLQVSTRLYITVPADRREVASIDQAIRDRISWEQNGFQHPNLFFEIRDNISGWRQQLNLEQRRAAVRSRWDQKRKEIRQKLLYLLKNREVTLRMKKPDTSYPKRRKKVTSRVRNSDIPHRKR